MNCLYCLKQYEFGQKHWCIVEDLKARIDGLEYCIAELVESATEIKRDTFSHRVKSGWPAEKAASVRVSYKEASKTASVARLKNTNSKKPQGKLYSYNGKKVTLREISDDCGISPATLRARMNIGYTLEAAIERGLPKKVIYNNESITISELSRKTNISYNKLKYRLTHGWPVERAISVK